MAQVFIFPHIFSNSKTAVATIACLKTPSQSLLSIGCMHWWHTHQLYMTNSHSVLVSILNKYIVRSDKVISKPRQRESYGTNSINIQQQKYQPAQIQVS